MTISIVDPGYDWAPLFWVWGISGGALLVALLIFLTPKTSRRLAESCEEISQIVAGVAVIFAIIASLFVGIGVSMSEYEHNIDERIVQALEDKGFHHVKLDGRLDFSAEYQDDYFRGALLETEEALTWEILERDA